MIHIKKGKVDSEIFFPPNQEVHARVNLRAVHTYYWPDKRPQHWGSNCIFFRGCMCSAATEIGR